MSFLDSAMLQRIAPAMESAVNTALTMDPGAQKHLHRLRGCILEVHITSPDRSFFFGVESQDIENLAGQKTANETKTQCKVCLLPGAPASSVQLTGSASAFIKLASYREKNILFKTKEIQLSGDSVRAQQIQAFMQSINIDWEGLLATFIGDVPAHILGSSLRNGFSWGKMFSQSLIRDAEEFIKYEVRMLPSKAIAKNQFAAIDKLYQATGNLEKRIKKIRSAVNTRSMQKNASRKKKKAS